MREWKLDTPFGSRQAYAWEAENPWCVVHLAHGMAEHIARYDSFARHLSEIGVTVCGVDFAGHGKSVAPGGIKGYFGEGDALEIVLGDLDALRRSMTEKYSGVPYVLMGHSMGSLIARCYAMRRGEGLAGLILSGTSGGLQAAALVRLAARVEAKRTGMTNPSERLDTLAFGSYNRLIPEPRTKFDWLSRDAAAVDAYIADKNCGFLFTGKGFVDLLAFTRECSRRGWARGLKTPVLLLSGAMDPVGGYGKGVENVAEQLRAAGVHTTCVIYPDARHEMLNETNKQEVYKDVDDWLRLHIRR